MQPHKEAAIGLLVYIFIAALLAVSAVRVIDMFKGVY
jgi:hypothetical protein